VPNDEGPWTRYAATPTAAPWEKYGSQPPAAVAAPAKPSNDPMRGATQATGLSPDTRSSAGKIWDEVKRGLTSAQAGQGLKPQPTMTANVAQFAGMAGDTLSQFGVAPPAAEAAGAAERTIGKLFKPTTSMVPETTNLLGPTGKPLIKMVQQEGPSVASKAVEKLNKTALIKLAKKAIAAYGTYEAAKKFGVPLP
jgi:hypothetical protein